MAGAGPDLAVPRSAAATSASNAKPSNGPAENAKKRLCSRGLTARSSKPSLVTREG